MGRIRPKNKGIFSVQEYEGEFIETKCARIINDNQPISDGAPLIYTEKKDGIRPEFNIRTDKWEIAQNAMDAVNKDRFAKGNQLPEPTKTDNDTKEKATES